MPCSKNHSSGATLKEKVEIVQAVVTMAALVVGGYWTYNVFVKERRAFAHANIEQKISHVALTEKTTLLRVGVDLTNTGSSLMSIEEAIVRVQQILPLASCATEPCARTQVREALSNTVRKDDQFSWPLIGERELKFTKTDEVEPGEKQTLDFEFAVPSSVKLVRVYTYFQNKQKSGNDKELGWATSGYYDFATSSKGGKK